MIHKPIGGVKVVSLRFVNQTSGAIIVPIIDDSSEYIQSVSGDRAPIVVEHSLTLSARRVDALQWLTEIFVERAILEGFVATVEMNDGRTFSLGSEASPLRLVQFTDRSNSSIAQTPTVTLTLKCENSTLR